MSNEIKYYNTNSILVDTPTGKEYGGVSAWQGIRSLGSEQYIICGTTNPTPNTGNGLIYVGNIDCQNGSIYYLNVPESLGTSLYGPDYDKETGLYTIVGSYLDYNQDTKGFIYEGRLDELNKSLKFIYPKINSYYNTNFLHSNSNGLIIGNSGNTGKNLETISYIYELGNSNKIKTLIQYPNSNTTTSYGIWYNGNNNYSIVGGYSNKNISIDKIYRKDGILIPIGNAFIVSYNCKTNKFSDWTTINFGDNLLSHFEGISRNKDNSYTINADVVDLNESKIPSGYFLRISKDKSGSYNYNIENAVKIEYNSDGLSSSNSVADNKVVGLYIGSDNTKVSYQCAIFNKNIISKTNTLMKTVKNGEIIRFDKSFINNSNISYKDGVFTFLQKGSYFNSFNIYIENTNLASIQLSVEYLENGKKKELLIAQKGIDEIGTGTAHSLVIPCSFIKRFNINDTLKIRNVSDGSIDFISNYVEDASNGIISIYKL
jgi:hypothetical protein